MRRIIILIYLVFVALCSCKQKEKIYYFFNASELFEVYENSNDSMSSRIYVFRKVVLPADSFTIAGGSKIYGLSYYHKYSDYSDPSFVKNKSYLDSINFYGTEWFKNEDNLNDFWKSAHGQIDSLKIYTIEPIKGTDSLLFRRVHRFLHLLDE